METWPRPNTGTAAAKAFEVAGQRDAGLAGHDTGAHRRRDGFEVHAQRVYTGVVHAGEPGVVVGRLALALDRQVHSGFDGSGAFGQDGGAAVVAGRGAGGQNHVLDAVQFDRGLGDLGELGGGFALDRAAGGERLADGAELAGLGAALVADAGLQHRRRQHVAAVQDGDLRVRDAVRRWSGRRSAGASGS